MTLSSAWTVVAERMAEHGIVSEYALAQLLSEASGRTFETTRKAVKRWRLGRRPGKAWRELLAQVLGGEPADYESQPASIRLVSSQDVPEDTMDDLREEVLGSVERLWQFVHDLDMRLRRLEGERPQQAGGQS